MSKAKTDRQVNEPLPSEVEDFESNPADDFEDFKVMPKAKKPVKPEPLYFEEWSVRLSSKREQEGPFIVEIVTPVKLEKLRDRVVIDQHHADILNEGRLAPSCVNPILYFKPGQDVSEFTRKYYPKTN